MERQLGRSTRWIGFHDCRDNNGKHVSRRRRCAACAHPSLARALDHVSGLDDAVKLEAAILVDGRHDAHAGGHGLGAVKTRLGGCLELHASRADGRRRGGRVLLRVFRHGSHGVCCIQLQHERVVDRGAMLAADVVDVLCCVVLYYVCGKGDRHGRRDRGMHGPSTASDRGRGGGGPRRPGMHHPHVPDLEIRDARCQNPGGAVSSREVRSKIDGRIRRGMSWVQVVASESMIHYDLL
jgi:hypothetical protein